MLSHYISRRVFGCSHSIFVFQVLGPCTWLTHVGVHCLWGPLRPLLKKVWSTVKIRGTRVPQKAIVPVGRPSSYFIIVLNMLANKLTVLLRGYWNCLTQACIDMPSKHKTFVWLYAIYLLLFINSSFKSAYSHSVDQGAVQLKIYIYVKGIILFQLIKINVK